MECDYGYEARCQARFKVLVESDPEFAAVFHVPAVMPELSTERVLTTELVHGVHIDQARRPARGLLQQTAWPSALLHHGPMPCATC